MPRYDYELDRTRYKPPSVSYMGLEHLHAAVPSAHCGISGAVTSPTRRKRTDFTLGRMHN